MKKQILILGLLISSAALADCERTEKVMGRGTDKCQLCFKEKSGKQTYGNPWSVVPKMSEKQKLAVGLNSVLCKQPDNQAKSFALPNEDSEITNEILFKAIEAIYKRLPDSGLVSYPSHEKSDGCDNIGPPSIYGLKVKYPGAQSADPIGYLTKTLNACMVKLGPPYAKKYCFFFGDSDLPTSNKYSQLRKGVVGLLFKTGVISDTKGFL